MFRRRLSRVIRRMGRQNVLPMLQHANQLLVGGSYAEAALAFEQLAHGAEDRFSERAPFLYLQAGRAAILDGQVPTGVVHLRRGLTLLGAQGRFLRLQMLGRRIIDELNGLGLKNEAAEIAGVLNENAPVQTEPEPVMPAKKPTLPTHCPACGGSLRPDEVEWLDEVTAECAYCGSPVRADN